MSSAPVLPPGWVEADDPSSGRKYYANPNTGETQWDPPPKVSCSKTPHRPRSHSRSNSHSSKRRKSNRSGQFSSSTPGKGSVNVNSKVSETLAHDGNILFNAPEVNVALKDSSKLVPLARDMLAKAASFPVETIATDLELKSLTVGQISDLCRIQHETTECGDNVAYNPLNPYRMTKRSSMVNKEEGRIDVRLFALKQKLKQSSNWHKKKMGASD